MYISSLEIWPATWKSYLACRLGYFLTMHSFSTSHICAIFRMENCCHVEFFYIVTMSYYWIDRSAYRGKVLIQTVASILTALNHKIYNWLKSVPPFKHSEANMIDYFLSKSSMQHTACWICNLKKNFGKLILRKCGKDKSRHWSRCFVIISFIAIGNSLLLHLLLLLVSGLPVSSNHIFYQIVFGWNSVYFLHFSVSSHQVILDSLLLISNHRVILVGASFVIKTIPHMKNFKYQPGVARRN